MPHELDARVSLIPNMDLTPSPAPPPPSRNNLARTQPNTSPSTAPSTHPCQSADHRFVKGNGHFSSEADTIVGFDNEEEPGPSRNGGNGHVDNHYPINGQMDGTDVPRLTPSVPDDPNLPSWIVDPTTSQFPDINAPNVSPAAGAAVWSSTPLVPPLDLQSRLQHEEALQHSRPTPALPPGISIQDFAGLGGPVGNPYNGWHSPHFGEPPDHDYGASPIMPGYEGDTESPEP